MFCPYCEKDQKIISLEKSEILHVKGEPVKYVAKVYKCTFCKGEFTTTELEEENFVKAYDLYREKHHLVTPEKIKKIRKNYELSQKDFSRFLGWGEITIHRYESGGLQDNAHNDLLILVEDPQNALKIFEQNKDRLDIHVASRLEKRIEELIGAEKSTIAFPLSYSLFYRELKPTIENGYKSFDIEKTENLILYIAEKCDGVFKTVLNKLLWYADFKHFKEHTIGITGLRYINLPYGPVPENYNLFTWKLEMEGRIESQEVVFEEYSGEKFIAKEKVNMEIFDKNEKNTINFIIRCLCHFGAKKISKRSHREKGYMETFKKQIIPYTFAKDLSI